jgi:predicted secreted protein
MKQTIVWHVVEIGDPIVTYIDGNPQTETEWRLALNLADDMSDVEFVIDAVFEGHPRFIAGIATVENVKEDTA